MNNEIIDAPEMFLKNSIERILNDRDIKRKDHASLKKACESALEQLQQEIDSYARKVPEQTDILPNYQSYILADGYFLPFELACHSNCNRIAITALDSLQV
uniref:Uncharacterized protein n=1 Tax=Acrobeloides nanus TaxID=290746 RepID=A0A914D473_9BILA